MFKTYFLFKPGGDPFRFQGAEAASYVKSRFPALCGYVQTRALPQQDAPAFSGSAELWFANAQASIDACERGPGELAAADAELQSSLAGMERVVTRTPAYMTSDRIKGVYPFCRKEGMAVDAFQSYWWHNHGPIAAMTEEALAYVQIHPVAGHYELSNTVYDGVTEISWPDEAAAGRALTSRQMAEDQGSDAPKFVKMDSVALFLAKEEIVVQP